METYRRDRSYLWNYRHGPQLTESAPRCPATAEKELFGLRVGSRFGIAAGLLLNSRWIDAYARRGFDILTYKTVRTAERPCYPLPNWVYVEAPGGIDVARDQVLRVARRRPRDTREVTSAVCFGMPSLPPEVWREDVRRAKESLASGKALIVSVVGTPGPGGGAESLIEDFVRCARWAADAGADIVEANYSCPNVCTPEGSVFRDAALSRALTAAIRDAIPSTPFFIKAGHFEADDRLRELLRALSGKADAAVLVNGISRRVLREDGRPAFGAYERVGILGRAIHAPAVSNVARAARIVEEEGLAIRLIAVGGVMEEDGPGDFFDAGAAAVLAGGAPMFDPDLAIRMKAKHPEW